MSQKHNKWRIVESFTPDQEGEILTNLNNMNKNIVTMTNSVSLIRYLFTVILIAIVLILIIAIMSMLRK